MVEKLGKIALSFLITHWLYAEALLFVPQLRPFCERIIATARIPTHVEWPGIMSSKSAAALGSDITHYVENSSFRVAFEKVGVLNPRVRRLQQTGRGAFGDMQDAFQSNRGSGAYRSGEDVFVNTKEQKSLGGSYESFTL